MYLLSCNVVPGFDVYCMHAAMPHRLVLASSHEQWWWHAIIDLMENLFTGMIRMRPQLLVMKLMWEILESK